MKEVEKNCETCIFNTGSVSYLDECAECDNNFCNWQESKLSKYKRTNLYYILALENIYDTTHTIYLEEDLTREEGLKKINEYREHDTHDTDYFLVLEEPKHEI